MGTHRFDVPDSSRARGTALTHTTVREDVQRVRISFCGEIDLSSADLVDAAINDALRSHQPRRVDVDLGGVRFMDSSGINALMRCRAHAVQAGCQLAVTNPNPMTYRILEVTGVLTALAVAPAQDDPIDG